MSRFNTFPRRLSFPVRDGSFENAGGVTAFPQYLDLLGWSQSLVRTSLGGSASV